MTGTAIADLSHIPVSQGLSTTLARASEGARASGAPEVSLEHVLAALCDDADAADVLVACGIDPARLKGDVIRFIVQQTGGAAQPVIGPVTVSPALVRILEAAAAAARGGRRRDINGAIVLAAVVGDARSFAAQILQEHGLTFDEAIKALQAAQSQPPRATAADVPRPAEDVLARARERVQSRAAPSLREMMARPQLAERPAPPQGFQDIVPSPAAAQNWPQAPVETNPDPASARPEPMPAEAPVIPAAAIAPEPEPDLPPEAEAPPEADLAVAANKAKSDPPAEITESAATASPTLEARPPPAPVEAPQATPQEQPQPQPQPPAFEPPSAAPVPSAGQQPPPPGGPSLPHNPFPAGGPVEPRWAPAGDLPQMPAPSEASPPPNVAQREPAGGLPPGPFPGNTPARSPTPSPPPGLSNHQAPGPLPSAPAYDRPPAGLPPLAGAPPHALPPLPPAPPPAGFRPANQGIAPSPSGSPLPPPGAGSPPPFSPFPPSGPPGGPPRSGPPHGFEGGRQGPMPPPIPPALPGAPSPRSHPYGVPASVSAPQMAPPVAAPAPPAARSAATPPPRRDAAAQAELGQLAENIPRTMRAGVTERVEIRLARAHVHDLTGGMDGGGLAWRHDVTVTKAMSVRIRAPEGGFFIETASPETQWIDNQLLDAGEDYASWRFLITPQQRGWSELQIVVSARTVGSDGLAAETAFPDQHIDIKVRTNYGRAALKGLGWAAAAIAGGAIAKFGEGAYEAGSTLVAKLLG